MTALVFSDLASVEDLRTFVGRARAADEDGAIRLQASGTTLAAYVGVLPGAGLLADGAVLGLRVMALAQSETADVTVSLAALGDRLARGELTVPLPPVTVAASWSAVAAPRSGWERVSSLPTAELAQQARAGIAEVARGVGGSAGNAGSHAVATVRRAVWGRLTPTVPPVPAGAAFAAYVLGFTEASAEATVWTHGRWTRLSMPSGHVLVRGVPAAAPTA